MNALLVVAYVINPADLACLQTSTMGQVTFSCEHVDEKYFEPFCGQCGKKVVRFEHKKYSFTNVVRNEIQVDWGCWMGHLHEMEGFDQKVDFSTIDMTNIQHLKNKRIRLFGKQGVYLRVIANQVCLILDAVSIDTILGSPTTSKFNRLQHHLEVVTKFPGTLKYFIVKSRA